MARSELTVTKLARSPVHGEWECNVTVDGQTYRASREWHSWELAIRVRPGARTFRRAHPPAWVACELQRRVKRLEWRERNRPDEPQDAQQSLCLI